MSKKRSRRKSPGSWVHVGSNLDAPTFENLDTGERKHIGEDLLTGAPKVYDGEPSLRGRAAREIVKRVLRQKK